MAERNRAAAEKEKSADKEETNRFTKAQLLSSRTFEGQKDLLNAVLSEERQYTIIEAGKLLEDFMKGKVN